MEAGGREGEAKVRDLIERATNSTAREVDGRLLKAIKYVVRYSDSEMRTAAETLMDHMKRDHSQVRYLTLLIIDELFMRSKLFRTLLVENLDQLLSLSVGFRRNLPLPSPPTIATLLRSKAIEFLEKWSMTYGVHYRQLRLGFDYLKNILKLQFPNLQANASRVQQERRERENRTKEILRKKFASLGEIFSPLKIEIQSTILEIKECLDIVQTQGGNVSLALLDEEDPDEEFRSSELRQIRLDSLKEGEKVQETSENKVVFDALRELYKLLVTKHLVSVQEWLSVLIRVDTTDNRFRDSMLKDFIDIRNQILVVKRKCEEAGCGYTNTSDPAMEAVGEEDFWVDYKMGSAEDYKNCDKEHPRLDSVATTSSEVENRVVQYRRLDFESSEASTRREESNFSSEASNRREESNFSSEASNRREESNFSSEASNRCEESNFCESVTLRDKLIAEAPVMKWGSQLDKWGSDKGILANQRGMEFESHWGRVDYDVVIPAEKIAELNLQSTYYKAEKIEIQPCRAPLRKGGLCQRKDLRVCPFHGHIIPRDENGNPIKSEITNQSTVMEEAQDHESSSSSQMGPDFASDLSKRLSKEALKNVRERDQEKAKKRVAERHADRRAKLAKVREHNEAVLRDAALASTSRSNALDDIEQLDRPVGRVKKGTLASMLQKKVTAKDRLGQRLLNSRRR